MTGKQNVIRLQIAENLRNNSNCLVVCKDYPKDICDHLDKFGIAYICEPSYVTPNMSPIYQQEEIVGWEQKQRSKTGYIFKQK